MENVAQYCDIKLIKNHLCEGYITDNVYAITSCTDTCLLHKFYNLHCQPLWEFNITIYSMPYRGM